MGEAGKLEFKEFWQVVEERVDDHGYGEPPGLVPTSGGLSRLVGGIHNGIIFQHISHLRRITKVKATDGWGVSTDSFQMLRHHFFSSFCLSFPKFCLRQTP